jgi:hypothetical protein
MSTNSHVSTLLRGAANPTRPLYVVAVPEAAVHRVGPTLRDHANLLHAQTKWPCEHVQKKDEFDKGIVRDCGLSDKKMQGDGSKLKEHLADHRVFWTTLHAAFQGSN